MPRPPPSQAGKVSLDDPVSMHVDGLLKKISGDSTMSITKLWGSKAAKVTVGHILQMRSGIQDYDTYPPDYAFPSAFDLKLLLKEPDNRVTPLEFLQIPDIMPEGVPTFMFEPGTGVAYSSTGFVLAGLVLTAHTPGQDWSKLSTKSFFPESVQPLLKDTHFFTDEPLPEYLSVQGRCGGYNTTTGGPAPSYEIYPQNSSIVGYTCANVVAPPLDVARFFYALLGERSVVNETTLRTMTQFQTATTGWSKGFLRYGTGLMLENRNRFAHPQPATSFDQWGTFIGHGGNVYGFTSSQGYYYGLNASFSIAVNADQTYPDADGVVACEIVQTAARILYGKKLFFGCSWSNDAEAAAAVSRSRL